MSFADLDQDNGEVVFAQKLASGEPVMRARAMRLLKQWIGQRVKNGPEFTSVDFAKLWKGLYYCMWMQDKMLLQEELTDNICELVPLLSPDPVVMLFVQAFINEMNRQWHKLDVWRVDKMMMLARRMLRACLRIAANRQYDAALMDDLFRLLNSTVFSPTDESTPDGFKYHFINIYLDEIDLAARQCPIDEATLDKMIEPFEVIVANRKTKQNLFDHVMKEIYETVLMSYVEENFEDPEATEPEPSTPDENGVKFDYGKMADRLFKIGADKETLGKRRMILYDMVKRLQAAARGGDPFGDERMTDGPGKMNKREVEQATQKLSSRMLVPRNERNKLKRKIKSKKQEEDQEVHDQMDVDEVTPKKKIKKVKPESTDAETKVKKTKKNKKKVNSKRKEAAV